MAVTSQRLGLGSLDIFRRDAEYMSVLADCRMPKP